MKKIVNISQTLSLARVNTLLERIEENDYSFEFDTEKLRLSIESPDKQGTLTVRLPIVFSQTEPGKIPELIDTNYIILLIQSGSAAAGFYENDANLDHKVFKSYMVRKKQGKSQIKYLNAKGKSRAGSRVRLANTIDFFENINERLQSYCDDYHVDRIAISCSKTLIPYLYNSKVACPFDKKDERIYKIPKHIHTPGYDVLVQSHQFLMHGEVSYQQDFQEMVLPLLNGI